MRRAPEGARFIALEGRGYPRGGERSPFDESADDAAKELPEQLASVLAHCDRLRTMEEHARSIHARTAGAMEPEEIAGHLEDLAGRGLLVSSDAIADHLRSTAAPAEVEPISTVAWVTRARLPELSRSIEGAVEHCRRYGRRPSFVVCDDGPNHEEAPRALSRRFAEAGVDLYYFGAKEKRSYVERMCGDLAAAGLERRVLEFALFGPAGARNTCGANRNALLLATAGSTILCLDDDVTWTAFARPGGDGALEITSTADPAPLSFFPDRETMWKELRPCDMDILAAHEALLGRSPAGIVSSWGRAAPAWGPADRRLVAALLRRSQGRVRSTMSGSAGTSGMRTPRPILWISDTERARVLSGADHYRACMRSNQVIRLAERARITNGPFLIGYAMGLDGREMLPPFLPVGRGSDGVFGMLSRKIGKDDLVGHLPFAVPHDPLEERTFSQGDLLDLSVRVWEVVASLIQSFPIPDAIDDPWNRMDMLGRHLREVSLMGREGLSALLKNEALRQLRGYVEFLTALLERHRGAPSFWADDVRRSLEAADALTRSRELGFPADLGEPGVEAGCETALREVLSLFGELLRAWRVIHSQAKAYRREGLGHLRKL